MNRVRIWILTALVVVGCGHGRGARDHMDKQLDAWLRMHGPGGQATCVATFWGISCTVSHKQWTFPQQVFCNQEGCWLEDR